MHKLVWDYAFCTDLAVCFEQVQQSSFQQLAMQAYSRASFVDNNYDQMMLNLWKIGISSLPDDANHQLFLEHPSQIWLYTCNVNGWATPLELWMISPSRTTSGFPIPSIYPVPHPFERSQGLPTRKFFTKIFQLFSNQHGQTAPFLSLSLTLLHFTRKQWLPSKFFLFYFRKKIHSGALSNMQTCTLWVHFVYWTSSSSPLYWILTPSWSFEGVGIQSPLSFKEKASTSLNLSCSWFTSRDPLRVLSRWHATAYMYSSLNNTAHFYIVKIQKAL